MQYCKHQSPDWTCDILYGQILKQFLFLQFSFENNDLLIRLQTSLEAPKSMQIHRWKRIKIREKWDKSWLHLMLLNFFCLFFFSNFSLHSSFSCSFLIQDCVMFQSHTFQGFHIRLNVYYIAVIFNILFMILFWMLSKIHGHQGHMGIYHIHYKKE